MGGVGHFQLAGIFFTSTASAGLFFLEGEGKSPARIFFWGEGVGIGGGNSLLPQSYVDTHHNLNPKFKQIFLPFIQSFCFPVKIILGGNITKYQTHQSAIA